MAGCRFIGDPSLWAVLAATAMGAGELAAAEAAFAMIGAVDKLRFVQRCARMPSAEARSAELALYRRQPGEAEVLLLQVRGRPARQGEREAGEGKGGREG